MNAQLSIPTSCYAQQAQQWPAEGRHILAHYDDETILVYQAYRPEIGNFAAKHGYFGGEFKYSRMSWIKPNFLWMMYRSDWGRSDGQNVVLAIRLRRIFFDSLLEQAVFSSFGASGESNQNEWKSAVSHSDVRLQWDPDHLPTGDKCERRAVQIGMRGKTLEAYGKREVLEIIDVSDFVAQQRPHASNWRSGELQSPVERVYLPDKEICKRLGLSPLT